MKKLAPISLKESACLSLNVREGGKKEVKLKSQYLSKTHPKKAASFIYNTWVIHERGQRVNHAKKAHEKPESESRTKIILRD